ncbi:MAG: AMP-binding protein [Dehalococcoidia bacterium]|nr:AMP-binding protein [Dehalococcoidia bacterium]
MAKQTRFNQKMIDDYVSRGFWNSETLADMCDRNAEQYPGQLSFIDSRTRLTWSQLKLLSDRVALGLMELGIKKDEVILVMLPNWVENIVLRIAFLKAGILSVFPALTWRQAEMERTLKSLNAVAAITPNKFRKVDYHGMIENIRSSLPSLRHLFVVGDDVPRGAISYKELVEKPLERKYPADYLKKTQFGPFEFNFIMATSGTTGAPKFCEHSQAAYKVLGRTVIERAKITSADVIGAIAPLSGGSAIYAFFCPLMVPARAALLDWFDAEEALKLIEKERISVAIVVPAQLIAMLRHPNLKKYDLSSLRVVRAGGAATPPNIAVELEEKVGCTFISGAGSMDAISISQAYVDDPPDVRYFTAGRPTIGNQIRIVSEQGKELAQGEVGEIQVRGACTASGYYKNMEATTEAWGELGENGWWRSGDLGRLDEQGNIVFVGRKKDVIIRGAQNIYPTEIENLLFTHPGIHQVAIVAMPDLMMGEKACAFVVPKPGMVLTFDEMVSFLKDKNIAPYKLPERLEIVENLPGAGDVAKVDKKALAKMIAEKLKAEGQN